MKDWISYRLSDLLLFSPRTYYRMFELYHDDVWPAQLVAAAIAIAMLALLRRNDRWSDAAVAGIAAACWMWVAVAFHTRRYAAINPAARYFGALFIAQALILVWIGVLRRRVSFGRTGDAPMWTLPVMLIALLAPPLVGRAAERTWSQVELVGLTPDATALATIGLLLVASPPAPRVLMVAPLVWCVAAGATLWALGAAEARVMIVGGLVAFLAMLRRPRSLARMPGEAAARTPSRR